MALSIRRPLAVLAAFALAVILLAAAALVSARDADAQPTGPAPQTRVFACNGTTDANAVITCPVPVDVDNALGAPQIVLVQVTGPAGGQSNLPDNISVIAAANDSVTLRIIGTQVVHYAGPEPGGHDGPLAYRNGPVQLVVRASWGVVAYCNANVCS
jgi:hypothetical protein